MLLQEDSEFQQGIHSLLSSLKQPKKDIVPPLPITEFDIWCRGIMRRCNSSLSLVLLLVACTGESKSDEFGVPYGEPSDDDRPVDTDTEGADSSIDPGYEVGDAILTAGTFPDPPSNGGQIMYEWVDVAIYDDTYAVQVGVSGVGLVSRLDGRVLDEQNNGRGYSVDSDGDLIVVGSRTERVGLWRFQEGEVLTPAGFIEGAGIHEKVAVDAELVAVAWRNRGLKLYQSTTDVQLLSTISATDAYAVDLSGERLVYSDAEELVLVDVSDPANPVELHRMEVDSEVRDIDFDGFRAAIGLGGNGIVLFEIENDRFVERGSASPPGSVFSLSLDQDHLWVASWATTTLYVIQEMGLLPLAQEDPLSSAMGVAASGGRAIVADWYQSTVLEQVDDRWGAEVHLPIAMRFREGESISQPLWVYNYGAQPLEIAFTDIPTGFSVEHSEDDSQSATIATGSRAIFSVSAPNGSWSPSNIRWTSNDPDESTGVIEIRPSNSGEGSLHPDFALPLVSRNGAEGTSRLSDFEGKVLFLSWWSDY